MHQKQLEEIEKNLRAGKEEMFSDQARAKVDFYKSQKGRKILSKKKPNLDQIERRMK